MKINLQIQQRSKYKMINKILESAHYIFTDEINNFEFKKISKYSKSKEVYDKISYDFKVVNRLICENDYFNAATILRAAYENIIYIIATSYKKDIVITSETRLKKISEVLKENSAELFTAQLEKEDFDEIYEYLSKMIHPSAVKELVSHIVKSNNCKMYFLNNLKYMMVTIEYIYLNYLNNRIKNEESVLDMDLIGLCAYVNIINAKLFSDHMKDMDKIVKKYMTHNDDNKYIEKRQKISDEFLKDFEINDDITDDGIRQMTDELTNIINNSKYKEPISRILK